MPRRVIEVDGERWTVSVSGRITQYVKDEFGLVFARGSGSAREGQDRRRGQEDAFHGFPRVVHSRECQSD